MKPHSFYKVKLTAPAFKFESLGPFAERFGKFPKGTVLPDTQVPACPRVKISDLPKDFVPAKYFEKNLEHNQQVASCCRNIEDHEIEARKTHPKQEVPDIYIIYCGGCGRRHIRKMCAHTDDFPRPIWDAS